MIQIVKILPENYNKITRCWTEFVLFFLSIPENFNYCQESDLKTTEKKQHLTKGFCLVKLAETSLTHFLIYHEWVHESHRRQTMSHNFTSTSVIASKCDGFLINFQQFHHGVSRTHARTD